MQRQRKPEALDEPDEPWRSFLNELDQQLSDQVTLCCLGGLVVTRLYGLQRTTSDLDFLLTLPNKVGPELVRIAGEGTPLARRYGVCVDFVTVVNPPDSYETRLVPLFTEQVWKNLRLLALEAHDLALTKLERNLERDVYDVRYMAEAGFLDPETLQTRYLEELRPYLTREAWHDQTLQFWLEMCWPDRFPPK
jgi:hypothetical protein